MSPMGREVAQLARFERKRRKPVGIGEKRLALACQRHLLAVTAEEGNAEVLLQLLDARRHIRRRPPYGLGSLGNAAVAGNGKKYLDR